MTVCLLRIGDGRDDIHNQSWDSAKRYLHCDYAVTVDDRTHDLGFAGAIQQGWDMCLDTGADWIVHLELDFTFNQPFDLYRVIRVLDAHPELAQIVLKRQAWNEQEKQAGGIVEQWPDEYTERTEGADTWTEHRLFWSTNVSVYSSRFCRLGWPQEPESERRFTERLLKDPHLRFAFWGGKFDPPLIHHIGECRTGRGY